MEKASADINKPTWKRNTEENGNNTAKLNNKSNAKQKRDSVESKNVKNIKSRMVTRGSDVSITLIDHAIMYSAKLPEIQQKNIKELVPPTPQ